MADLVAFLTARLDEDETTAKDHLCLTCGVPVIPLRNVFGITGYTHDGGSWNGGVIWQGRRCRGSVTGAEPVQKPARVLREVQAGRAILAEHHQWVFGGMTGCSVCHAGHEVGDPSPGPCPTLRFLAAVYSDHPEYDQEWA